MYIRGSFRKFVKREQKLAVKRLGGITSLVATLHSVHKFQGGDEILAKGGECPSPCEVCCTVCVESCGVETLKV